jgi:hypothetical protein
MHQFYHLQSQVDVWSDKAEEFHKIPKYEVDGYPNKIDAHKKCYEWLKGYLDTHLFICYANPRSLLREYKDSHIYFDKAILMNSMLECGIIMKMENILSVYDLVREASKRHLFTPNKGKKGRVNYGQENVY